MSLRISRTPCLSQLKKIGVSYEFVNYFSASTISSGLNYGINVFFAWHLGLQSYAELTAALLIGFFLASVSELGINQYYLSRFKKTYTVTIQYLGLRIFVVSMALVCLSSTTEVNLSGVELWMLSVSQIWMHISSSSAERLDQFGVVSNSIYFQVPIRAALLVIFLFSGITSHHDAINFYILANFTCGSITVLLLLVKTGYTLAKINVPKRTSKDSIEKKFVIPAFFVFLVYGRLDVIYFDLLQWGDEGLRDYYFYIYGLIFPLNQFFQVIAKYTFVKLQRADTTAHAELLSHALFYAFVLSVVSLLILSLSGWHNELCVIKIFIVACLILAFISSGFSAIFAIGIYTLDNGWALFRLAIFQFILANIFVVSGVLNLAVALAAGQALANLLGARYVAKRYLDFKKSADSAAELKV